MKNSIQSISLILAAGLAGVAFFNLVDVPFIAALPGETMLAVALSAAAISLAIYDYSRRVETLNLPCRVLRPVMPCTPPCSDDCSNHSDRKAA